MSPEIVSAWIALVRVQQKLMTEIEAALKKAGLPPLAWYDVLLELSRVSPDGMRPMELEEKLLLAQYSMSRLLDRMEKASLIERIKVPEDGRGQLVRRTKKGEVTQADIWPVYERVLRQRIAAKVSAQQAVELKAILRQLD